MLDISNDPPLLLDLPVAPRIEHREARHGDTVVDDYYWLREKSDPAVIDYLKAENTYTESHTRPIKPLENRLYDEMLGRIKQTDLSVPVRRGPYLYYWRTEEGRQYPFFCRRESAASDEQILLDLNALASQHEFVSLGTLRLSDDQNFLAYTIDHSGFRQFALQIKDLRTGATLGNHVERVTSLEWGLGTDTLFLTLEEPITKRSYELWQYGIAADSRELLYVEADERFEVECSRTRDKKYIFCESSSTDTTECRYLALHDPEPHFRVLLPREAKHRYYPDHREGLFYIRTNKYGKNFAIVTAPVHDAAPENWTSFVPHALDILIDDFDLFHTFAAVVERSQALPRLRIHTFPDARWTEIPPSEPVYSMEPGDTPDYYATSYRYRYQSFVTPPSICEYDTATAESKLLKREEILGGYDPARYTSQRLWVTSRDGVQIPVSLVYPAGVDRSVPSPLLLYGYGSYGIPSDVVFEISRLSLLDRGVAYAIAHVRGGSELGEQWREDGMLMKKRNTFNDFIDCAEFLIRDNWTAPDRLVIEGRSAGGLLVGAVVNERPDLFRAAHLGVPFVDVLNTMMDDTLPLTTGEYLEWGDPHDSAAYSYMATYSPYDNLKRLSYPALLVTSSLNDSQVMYWEPAKYVAKLRTLNTSKFPILLKIKLQSAGHGGASGRYDRLRDRAFECAWMLSQLDFQQ